MPNWARGTLRIKGKLDDIKRFVCEELVCVNSAGEEQAAPEWEESYSFYELKVYSNFLWLRNSRRHFIEPEDGMLIDKNSGVLCMQFKAAWCIEAKALLEHAKKHNLDMRIYAFEQGVQFNQEIEIINGEITKDRVIKFDDYQWDCICPYEGG